MGFPGLAGILVAITGACLGWVPFCLGFPVAKQPHDDEVVLKD
jgi:hypothetical protein